MDRVYDYYIGWRDVGKGSFNDEDKADDFNDAEKAFEEEVKRIRGLSQDEDFVDTEVYLREFDGNVVKTEIVRKQ